MTTDTTALQKRITKAVEQVTCLRWEDTDDCGYCESSMVTCRHSSYMYCDAHDTITKPGDRCPHAAEIAAAVFPIAEAEVRAAKAEAFREALDGLVDWSRAEYDRARHESRTGGMALELHVQQAVSSYSRTHYPEETP